MPRLTLSIPLRFEEINGRVFHIPNTVGHAWRISQGSREKYLRVTSVYSGRSWEEFWGNSNEGIRGRIERGDLIPLNMAVES